MPTGREECVSVSGLAPFKILSPLAVLACFALPTPPPAYASVTTVGLAGWQVQSGAQAPRSGQEISKPGFATGSWLQVRPDDAGAPGTEVGALVQTGHCPDVFFSTNLKQCFGYMSSVGRESVPQFSVPWWFRSTFASDLSSSQHAQLIVNGVV